MILWGNKKRKSFQKKPRIPTSWPNFLTEAKMRRLMGVQFDAPCQEGALREPEEII